MDPSPSNYLEEKGKVVIDALEQAFSGMGLTIDLTSFVEGDTNTRFIALSKRYAAAGWTQERFMERYLEKSASLAKRLAQQTLDELDEELETIEGDLSPEEFDAIQAIIGARGSVHKKMGK